MPASIIGNRPSPAATAPDRFWRSAKRLASVADAAASASPEALIEAGVRSHPRHAEAGDLVAELAQLSDKIDEVRARLAGSGDPLFSPRQHDEAEKSMRKLVEDSLLVDPTAFVQRRNVTRQALSKALAARRVFYVEVEGRRHFPTFFLDSRYERRQVEEVSKALGDLPGTSKLQFFTTGKASLEGRTPLEALAAGQFPRVRTAARGFAER